MIIKENLNHGHCGGHAASYTDDVAEEGFARYQMCLDVRTRRYQTSQGGNYSVDDSRPKWFGQMERSDYQLSSSRNWRALADNLVNSLRETHIYRISIAAEVGHGVPIRLLPGKGGIELRDPRFGLCVFPNLESCKDYLASLFSINKPFKTQLYKLRPQPSNAKASIPLLGFQINKDKNKKHIDSFLAYLQGDCFERYETAKLTTCTAVLYERIEYASNQIYILMKPLDDDQQLAVAKALMKEQIARYCVLRKKILGTQETKEASEPQLRENIEIEHGILKRRVLEKIDKEITRLQGLRTGREDAAKIIAALEVLKLRIQAQTYPKSLCAMSLGSIIDIWLQEKPKGGTQTYENIIATKDETLRFVKDLRYHEINPHRLDILRTELLIRICGYFGLDKPDASHENPIRNKIKKLFEENTSPRDILIIVTHTAKSIAGRIFGRDESAESLYDKLQTLDVDDAMTLVAANHAVLELAPITIKDDSTKLTLQGLNAVVAPATNSVDATAPITSTTPAPKPGNFSLGTPAATEMPASTSIISNTNVLELPLTTKENILA